MIEERERTDFEETLLHGACHLLAVALHDITGLPLGAYMEYDFDIDGMALVHAFVIDGEHAIDVRGRFPTSEILEDEFTAFEPDFVLLTREQLCRLGEGRKTISKRNPRYVAALEVANDLLLRLELTRDSDVSVGTAPSN